MEGHEETLRKGAERVLRAFLVLGMVTIFMWSKQLSPSPQAAIRELVRGGATWKSYGALAGLFAGLTAPVFGSLFTMVSWVSNRSWHGMSMHGVGTAMFALGIPLLVLGAHCLDLLEKEKNQARSR